jgi:uncharacterized protein YutE (UPF0331/DUF86 family)
MLEKLKLLEENIKELDVFRNRFTIEDIADDKTKEWGLRYGLFETIQIVIDIACHLVSKYNLGSPETYAECIELLRKNGYITSGLAERLAGMVGLRNILVHEYVSVDRKRLFEFLYNIEDFRSFILEIKEHI